MPGYSPPINCGVYLFSVRFYEEVGFPARTSPTYEGEASSNDISSSRERRHSVASASGSEIAKVITQHQ
jgi:hypothetical protein